MKTVAPPPTSNDHFTEERVCRLCAGADLGLIISLGPQPLANALPSIHDEVELFPLNLMRCPDCGLVQIRETVSPDILFRNYLYFSSYADTLLENARTLTETMVQKGYVKPGDQVVEIGSNDGYLLQFYKDRGIGVLGVEPAANVAEHAKAERGIPTKIAFFNKKTAQEILIEYGPAQVIHANNVLAHTADLHSVIEGISILLSQDGMTVAEVQYFKDMADMASFDMIYHEHLCYYILGTFEKLLAKHGLRIFHAEHIETHGGSLRVFACKRGEHPVSEAVYELKEQERMAGLLNIDFYLRYAARVEETKKNLLKFLGDLKNRGKMVVAYGAAAKATVMFNYFSIDSTLIRYVVDRNPHKQGRFIPGIDLVIRPVEAMKEECPDFIFLSAWNLAGEIMLQLEEYAHQGVKFIIPFPEVKIV